MNDSMKHLYIAIGLLFFAGLLMVGCTHKKGGSRLIPFAQGYGYKTDPFIITTAEQLAWLAQAVNAGKRGMSDGSKFSDKYYKLGADIDRI